MHKKWGSSLSALVQTLDVLRKALRGVPRYRGFGPALTSECHSLIGFQAASVVARREG